MRGTFLSLGLFSSSRSVFQAALAQTQSSSCRYPIPGIYVQALRKPFHNSSRLSTLWKQQHPSVGGTQRCPAVFRTCLVQPLLHRNFPTNLRLLPCRKSSDFCPPKTAERLRQRDGMPKGYTLIYRSDFANYLLGAQACVFVTMSAAFFTLVSWAVTSFQDEEEKQQKKLQRRQFVEEKDRQDETNPLTVSMREMHAELGPGASYPSKPKLEDMNNEDPWVYAFLVSTLAIFSIALVRIMRLMPIRIYMNNKNHCVGIYYGHVIPGKLTYGEFLAGTVKKVRSKLDKLEFYTGDNLYKDGSGKNMILMIHYFRYPADYNKLLGIQEEFTEEALRHQQRDTPSKWRDE